MSRVKRSLILVFDLAAKAGVGKACTIMAYMEKGANDSEYNMEKIMKIIQTERGRIGLFPININHIKKYIDMEGDSDEEIYKDEKYYMARRNTANEFLVEEH